MSQTDYSAKDVIDRYETGISAWEYQLRELEEQAKGLSMDKPQDRKRLAKTARDLVPDIVDTYQRVQDSRKEVKELEGYIEDVLDNPKTRYAHIPESLNKQEQMKDRIQELDETFYITEERQDYISYELEETVDMSVDDYLNPSLLPSIDRMKSRRYSDRIDAFLSKPENVIVTGIVVGGLGLIALDRLLKRRNNM